MGLSKLWGMARPIPKELELVNKYTWLGVNNLLPVKYLDLNDTIIQPDIAIKNYLIKNEAVLLFPNTVNNIIVNLYIYPLYNKGKPLKLGVEMLPYNIGKLREDFKYGDPLILVEGIGDLAALKLMDTELDVVAMCSSKLSLTQVEFLSHITNNIIVIPDNDDAGNTGFTKMWYQFRDFKINAVSIDQFRYFKDVGDFLDKVVYYYKTNDSTILDDVNLAWKFYITAIETEKKNKK